MQALIFDCPNVNAMPRYDYLIISCFLSFGPIEFMAIKQFAYPDNQNQLGHYNGLIENRKK